MAIIKVLAQRNEARLYPSNTSVCHLTAFVIKGEFHDGIGFTAFETHHPVALKVLAWHNEPPYPQLVCETEWTLYEDQFVGAVLDSSGGTRGTQFFYDHNNEHGPAPL